MLTSLWTCYKAPSFCPSETGNSLHFLTEKVGLRKAGDQEQPLCLGPHCSDLATNLHILSNPHPCPRPSNHTRPLVLTLSFYLLLYNQPERRTQERESQSQAGSRTSCREALKLLRAWAPDPGTRPRGVDESCDSGGPGSDWCAHHPVSLVPCATLSP